MFRAAALSMLVLISIALLLPLSVSLAFWGHAPSAVAHFRGHHRHSRAWWRRHHARIRRMREAHNRGNLFGRERAQISSTINSSHAAIPGLFGGERGFAAPSSQPTGLTEAVIHQWRLEAPKGWDGSLAMAARQMKFYAFTSDGKEAGQAVFSLVPAHAHSGSRMFGREMRHALAGVPLSDLRRIVIDRMIASGGWVVNDVEQDFGDRRVFVVLAQGPGSGDSRLSERAWAFYFTEAEGRIYSLTTNSPLEFSDRMSAESARLLASFHTMGQSGKSDSPK